MEEVQGQAGNASLRKTKVSVSPDNMQEVRGLCQKLPSQVKAEFRNQYGRIMSLLSISVDGKVLSALAQFWNPDLHCFELPELDTVPTIEEYEAMLCIPIRGTDAPYIYQGCLSTVTEVMRFLEMPNDCLDKPASSLKKRKVVEYLTRLFQQRRWDLFKKTLAFVIFGMILFPYERDHISQESVDVYLQYECHRASPVPAILSETLLTLNFCHGKKKASLRCCLHLLYVWIITHCYAKGHMGDIPDPFHDFGRIPKKELTLAEWGDEFSMMKALQYTWVCPWFCPESVITSCGEFPYVPLMGPRGCITYTPTLVFRQYRRAQSQPTTEQLKSWHFYYAGANTKDRQVQVKKAWDLIRRVRIGELGGPHIISSQKYRDWRRARINPTCISSESPQKGETSQNALNANSDLVSQIERLKAHVASLERGDEAKEEKIRQLVSEAQAKDAKVAEQADRIKFLNQERTAQVGQKRARNDKEDAPVSANERKLQEQVKGQRRAIASLAKEKSDLEASFQVQLQQNASLEEELKCLQDHTEGIEKKLLNAENDACHGWQVSKEYYHSLMEANRDVEWLKVQVERLTTEGKQLRIILDNNSEDARLAVHKWQEQRRRLESEKDRFALQFLKMSQDFHVHSSRWVKMFDKATRETITVAPAIFPEMKRFLGYSRQVADLFRGMKGIGLEAPPAQHAP